jgi:tRNA threonylcarbamoyladenosine biosynthesis protein TsaE
MSNIGWSDSPVFPEGGLSKRIISNSEEETKKFGYELGMMLKPNSIVCFFGDLGAGKTTFIKGVAAAVSDCHPEEVNSPTYVYLNIYAGRQTLYHFDLYRLRDVDEFLGMGFDEYLFARGICCLEWSERIQSLIPDASIRVNMKNMGNYSREISIYM